jgi:hypothetical protein
MEASPLRSAITLRRVGWLMLFIGLLLPVLLGYWLLRYRRADVPLTLIGLVAVPTLIWAGSLGAKIGPCDVGDCMTSKQHSHLVIALVALGILAVAVALLAMHQELAAGLTLVVADVVGAFSMTRTDTPTVVMLLILAAMAAGYLLYRYLASRPMPGVPDYPPSA